MDTSVQPAVGNIPVPAEPISASDIEEMQAQLASIATDPSLTVGGPSGSVPDVVMEEKTVSTGLEKKSVKAGTISKEVRGMKFLDEIKILLIPQPHLRLVCQYLAVDDVSKVKGTADSRVAMIGLILQSSIRDYMQSNGFKFEGEFLLTNQGAIIPAEQHTWTLNGDVKSFTCDGIMFFDAGTGRRQDNIVIQVATDFPHGKAIVHCYANTEKKAKLLLDALEVFAKQNNCLRGGKLRDVNVNAGTFVEVTGTNNHTWENFFYPKAIKNMFDLEVFGFLENREKYNKYGIRKRGVLLHGPPGTGKTTLGRIICHYAKNNSVLWVTPDMIAENNAHKMSIKLLYELADFIGPSVILLEDLDLFTEDRDAQQGNMALGALMNILDGINAVTNIVTVATTNRLELIEKALSNRPGRFDVIGEIGWMERPERLKMFTDRLKNCQIDAEAMSVLVDKTEEWTAAECNAFVESMNLYFIRKGDEIERKINVKTVEEIIEFRERFTLKQQTKKRKTMGFH